MIDMCKRRAGLHLPQACLLSTLVYVRVFQPRSCKLAPPIGSWHGACVPSYLYCSNYEHITYQIKKKGEMASEEARGGVVHLHGGLGAVLTKMQIPQLAAPAAPAREGWQMIRTGGLPLAGFSAYLLLQKKPFYQPDPLRLRKPPPPRRLLTSPARGACRGLQPASHVSGSVVEPVLGRVDDLPSSGEGAALRHLARRYSGGAQLSCPTGGSGVYRATPVPCTYNMQLNGGVVPCCRQ